jgi:hypothetical protein
VQPQLAVLLRSRADRVAGDVHLDLFVDQVEDRLVHADMGFDPADEGLVAPAEVKAIRLDGGEAQLLGRLHPVGQVLGDLGHGLPEPLGVLLGDQYRHAHRLGALDELRHRSRDLLERRDRLAEPLLHVDDHQRRPPAVELHSAHAATPMLKLRSR